MILAILLLLYLNFVPATPGVLGLSNLLNCHTSIRQKIPSWTISQSSPTSSSAEKKSNKHVTRKWNRKYNDNSKDIKPRTVLKISADMNIQAKTQLFSTSSLPNGVKNKYVVDTIVSTVWS